MAASQLPKCVYACLFWRWRSACCSVQHLNHWVSVATTLEKCACMWQGERGRWVRSSVSDSFLLTTMETIAHKHPWVFVLTCSVKRQAACCACVCVCAATADVGRPGWLFHRESVRSRENEGRKFTLLSAGPTLSEHKKTTNTSHDYIWLQQP